MQSPAQRVVGEQSAPLGETAPVRGRERRGPGGSMRIPGPRVLVVDEDRAMRRLLDMALRARGYCVFEASTARDAVETVHLVRPDVVILDLRLPDGDGLDVIRRLHHLQRLRILVLSVRDAEEEKVEALEAGADDYVTKPFGIGELHARLRALLRRVAPTPGGAPLRVGSVEVDVVRRQVTASGEVVQLTPTEYDILKLLVQAGGGLLTRHQILREVWGPGYQTQTGLLRVNISNLRRKLDRDSACPSIIQTEPRIGYRLRVDG